MYCPNCGKENNGEQRFCRACGVGLTTISEALAGELSAPKSNEGAIVVAQSGAKKWQNPLLYGILLLTLGLLIIVVGKKVFGEQLVADIGTALAFIGVVLFAYRGIMLLGSQSGISTRQAIVSDAKPTLPESRPTKELAAASSSDVPASVTEHTTRQFERVRTKKNG